MIERDDPQDKDLAALYREASVEQPSTGLDARILAAARATAAPAKVAKSSWVNRWKVPVVLATLAVMTTTLTLLVQDEEAGRLDMPDTTLRKQRIPPPAAPEPTGPAAPAAAPAPAQKPAEARGKEAAPQARDSARQGPSAAPQSPSVAPPPTLREESGAANAEAAAPELSRSVGSVAAEKKAAQSPAAADELRSGNAAGGAIKDQPLLEKAKPQMQAAPAPMPAPSFAPAPAPARMAAPPARRADSAERDAARTPEQWIAEIRRLRQEGRGAEAEAGLAEFKKRYPHYALPEDLTRP